MPSLSKLQAIVMPTMATKTTTTIRMATTITITMEMEIAMAMEMATTTMVMAMAMEMATTTITMARAMAMMTTTAKKIMTCYHQSQMERNELNAKQMEHVTPKLLHVQMNAHRGSPKRTKRRRDAMLTVVANVKPLANVSYLASFINNFFI